MASLSDIKLRINSTKNIEHITKAMKMVSAARLMKAQERLEAARPYARKMAEVTIDLAAVTAWSFNKLIRPHPYRGKTLILVFTGDKGLAGGFHNNIVDKAVQFGSSLSGTKIEYYVIGRKGYHRFSQRKLPVFKRFESEVAGVTYSDAQMMANEIIDFYLREEFDVVYLYYAKFYSVLYQKPRSFQVLPIDITLSKKRYSSGLFVFEPNRKKLLDGLLPRYVESEVFRAFLETEAGELGARMAAMSAASDNAADIIEDYQLEFNRLRQAKITKELNEIIGGADALQDK